MAKKLYNNNKLSTLGTIYNTLNNVDLEKRMKEIKKIEEEREKKRIKDQKREERRIKNIKCPVCQSTKKEEYQKRESNGVFGPGGRSWISEEYLICLNCGNMYKDLKKKEKTNNYNYGNT